MPHASCLMPFCLLSFVLVGAPINVTRAVPNPSQFQIDNLHKKYVQGILKVFHRHKYRYGIPKDTQLIIQ
jgi:hypothetical protein